MPFDDILNAESTPQNWLTYSGTYAAHRFSYLDAINKSNVHRLRVSRVIQLSHLEPRFETTPLVMNGVMFFTEPPSKVIAIDLASGRSLWSYESDVPEGLSLCCVAGTRGVAVLDSTVIVGTIDALSVHATRYTRLGRKPDSGSCRYTLSRRESQVAGLGKPKRVLLCLGSRSGRLSSRFSICEANLGLSHQS